ncbi:hypothetical protein LIER_25126 [Lithospermum erythrorhizon]|uniref:Uncharacterized protein n=1 Tax=Lithospermum erythrorhizon TaxID=34254 RepID=A0AAV3R554_LITER
MCMQGMQWELKYILQGILLKTFKQLSTRPHDMELTIAANKGKGMGTPAATLYKAKVEDVEFKEPYNLYQAKDEDVEFEAIQRRCTCHNFQDNEVLFQNQGDTSFGSRNRPMLKEMQAREYQFFDSDTSAILEELLKEKLIGLPKSKRPKEANKRS